MQNKLLKLGKLSKLLNSCHFRCKLDDDLGEIDMPHARHTRPRAFISGWPAPRAAWLWFGRLASYCFYAAAMGGEEKREMVLRDKKIGVKWSI